MATKTKKTAKKTKKPTAKYVRFTERNDWEGETWRFYIPIKGNEATIEDLKEQLAKIEAFSLDKYGSGCDLEVEDETFDAKTVEALIKHSDTGYMPSHNKLKGKLVLPPFPKGAITEESYQNYVALFYKGDIDKLMK